MHLVGYMKKSNKDLVGTEINGLKIVDYLSKGKRQYFECHCVCGFYFEARVDAIKSGATKSCGCLTGDLISKNNRLPDNRAIINLVYKTYRDNAHKRQLKFKLSLNNFEKLILADCQYCGQKPQMTKFAGQENRRDRFIAYNGVDRVDNSVGYEVSNCVSCCSICNAAKSNLSYKDFVNWIKRLVRYNAAQENIQIPT